MAKLRNGVSLSTVWQFVYSYRDLVNFYNSFQNMKSREEIRKRIDYVIKNKLKQMNEIETLYWVLGEERDEEDNA